MPAMPACRAAVTPRLLQRLCYDVVQRGPTDAERRIYTGAELSTVAERLVHSREAMSVWYEEQLWYFLLIDQFRPAGDQIERIPARLQKREIDARQALGEILLSTGFTLRNPGNDTFVTVVLEQCLGYRVQDKKVTPVLEAGKRIYDGRKGRFLGSEGQNQSDLIQIVLRHEDFARHLLRRHHERLLGAPLPKDSPDVAALQQDFGAFFAILARWLSSDDYVRALDQRRPKSERQFLRGLYNDLLERTPDYDELRNLRNAMQAMADPAPLRSVLAKVILDSGKAKLPASEKSKEDAFVQRCFLRYLAREPGPREGEVFAHAMQQDGASPTHIVRALVGSLEYQTY